jgi:FkbM family methyltransferase
MQGSAALATRLSSGIAELLPDRVVGAAIRAVYPRIEPELDRIDDFVGKGGTAVDVGAWFGPWTSRLLRRADHVVALEPTAQLAAHLRAAFPQAQVVAAAASDHAGAADLFVSESGPAVGVSSLEHGHGPAVTVPLTTIDSLGLSDVRFMKLDVEGHELPALRGAATVIQRDRPVLFVELEERIQPVEPIVELLTQWGYVGYVLPGDQWVPLSRFDLGTHQSATVRRVRQSFVHRVIWRSPRYVNSVLFRPT